MPSTVGGKKGARPIFFQNWAHCEGKFSMWIHVGIRASRPSKRVSDLWVNYCCMRTLVVPLLFAAASYWQRSWHNRLGQYIDGLPVGLLGFDSRQCKIFLFSTASRPVVRPTQPPIQRLPVAHSLGIKLQGREADHSYLVSRSRMMDLYLHFHVRLHGIMLN
jgi:hypothetical protein